MYIADLHIHSRFSRATSRDGDAPHLDFWARRKGIGLVGTGDFTHPAWREELRQHLEPAGQGVYRLKEELRLPGAAPGPAPRFVVTGEISSIYKRGGKTRKVHNVILLPSLEAADELSARLEAIGNIRSDGRPILGLDSRDLLELTLEACPEAEFIPAHIWTPHFSMFGAFSGFDTIEECFADMTPHIHAEETGLSSDPPMNWRVSMLDGLTLVSHSDAHSPAKLGREADLLSTGVSYPELVRAIRTGEGFCGTVEFFPEEGKYHLDGHRSCGVCLTPAEAMQRGGLCPVCGKRLTIGVEHRVEELADRPAGFRPKGAKPYESLAPLPEVIAASTGLSAGSKKVAQQYEQLLERLGPEFAILREVPPEDIERAAGPCVAEGIRRLRAGRVQRRAGFDGEYGVISLLTPAEIEQLSGQTSLFGFEALSRRPAPAPSQAGGAAAKARPAQGPKPAQRQEESLNEQQLAAVHAQQPCVAVVAGPGTGKTKTLTARIAWLIEQQGARPEEITAVTFTNQAAAEMRQRLCRQMGGRRAAARLTIGTFHAICRGLLGDVRLVSRGEALELAADVLKEEGRKISPAALVQAVSRIKNGAAPEAAGISPKLFEAYQSRLQQLGMLDFDDLLTQALKLDVAGRRCFTHLLVDEFQDINDTQYELVRAWSRAGSTLFVIGDPDQAIYSFRGASGRCFERLQADMPGLRQIRLEQNYRSAPQILQAAVPVIEQNPGGPRLLHANCPPGPAVRLVQAADDFNEAVFIAKEIGAMTGGVDMLEAQKASHEREARAFSDIAVLCRTHRQLELVESCLRHDDIPCIVSGRESWLEDGSVRGFLAFFRWLMRPDDAAALETALRLVWQCPEDIIRQAQAACARQSRLDTAALRQAMPESGHAGQWLAYAEKWLAPAGKEKPWKLAQSWAQEHGACDAMDKLRHVAVFHSDMPALLDALALGQEADICRAAGRGWQAGAVRLMTLHGAKGLEFPAVFLAGVSEGTLPLEAKGRPADVEEERRLFYVGITRAKEELILTTGPRPSAFLQSLPRTVERESAARRTRQVEQLSLF